MSFNTLSLSKNYTSQNYDIMQTVTVEILNEKAVNLLQDLEVLNLIRLHHEKTDKSANKWLKYKGSLSKQTINGVDQQLNELRNAWE